MNQEFSEPRDQIFERFMEVQRRQALDLPAASEIFEISALDPQRYVATFHCKGLVSSEAGIVEVDRFVVGYQFDHDYLRVTNRAKPVLLFEPRETWHPNIRHPFICLGPVKPSTPLVELIYRTYEVLTYQKCTMHEDDAFNHDACVWARQHQGRFPFDRRPLKRLKRGTVAVGGEGSPA